MSPKTHALAPAAHFAHFARWLEMESQAERERLEERRKVQASSGAEKGGESLLGLAIRDHTVGPRQPLCR